MRAIAIYFQNLALNFRLSTIAFLMMRLTGIALAFYLVLHLFSIGQVLRGREAFDGTMAAYNSIFGHWIEYFLLLAVLFHAANGIRVMLGDFFAMTRRQNQLLWGTMLAAFVVAAVSLPRFIGITF